MAFDQTTRNRLQRFVNDARRVLEEEFTRQLQNDYGMDPNAGAVTDLASLRHINDAQRETARIVRDTLAHYTASGDMNAAQGLDRIVREQAFTVLNRLAALRMAEARGLLFESVGNGFQAKGFQLYARLAGTGLGETGDAYRVYLFSVFDELAQDLPGLFDRYSPQGRLFPREAALLQVLNLINDADIAPLWGQDETIGWIYQYFNSKEERKAMRDASQAPRNSRELAVRNQFFTPRYVVEFLVDNTLGRLWYEATRGTTALRERCQYLLCTPQDVFLRRFDTDDLRPGSVVALVQASRWSDLPTFDATEAGVQAMIEFAHCVNTYDRYANGTWGDYFQRLEPALREQRFADLSTQELWDGIFLVCRADRHGGDGSVYQERWFVAACQEIVERLKSDEPQRKAKVIAHHPVRDPRTLKLLDPACGSMHFGLYAFDLFAEIYREAWAWEQQHGPGSLQVPADVARTAEYASKTALAQAGKAQAAIYTEANKVAPCAYAPLCQAYADEAALLRDVPRLVIEHNIYGVDIDQRAAQIASLALWLRAQRAWHDAGVKAKDRPLVGRGHVVAAIAPPAEPELRQQFAATLDHLDAELFEKTLQLLKGLPELGVLLQVERELPDLIRQVFGEHGSLFKEADMEQWQKAEARLRVALTEFAQAAQSTYQGRLFAQDALQGLRLIDLCSEVFDVVVMNPPFGALAANTKDQLNKNFPNSKGDLLSIFVERGLDLLRGNGLIGAITSRAPFYLSSMEAWRKSVVYGKGTPQLFADLGMGVMDDAMVEAAAYVLGKQPTNQTPKIHCLRALTNSDKEQAIRSLVGGKNPSDLFEIDVEVLRESPGQSFAYWIPQNVLSQLSKLLPIDPSLVSIRVGMQTGDDWRFLRQWWEVETEKIVSVDNSGMPTLESSNSRQCWATYTKTDKASPWFSPLLQVAKWINQGSEYNFFLDKNGKSRARLQNVDTYFRPGFSYMLRSARLVPYIVPAGAIPTAGRAQGFGEGDQLLMALVIASSNLGSSWARLTGEMFERPKFQAGMVQSIPYQKLSQKLLESCRIVISRLYAERRSFFEGQEPYREFQKPAFFYQSETNNEWSRHSLIGDALDLDLANEYGLEEHEYELAQRDLQEAIAFNAGFQDPSESDASAEEFSEESVAPVSKRDIVEGLISYAIGLCFGRWDVGAVIDGKENYLDADPFTPLPKTPPGMLVFEDEKELLSQAYPINISIKGVLSSEAMGTSELVYRVRECFDVLSEVRNINEILICGELGFHDLEAYLNRASGFFADHLNRYTAGGRKAPIYWPLSTQSGSYTLWVYYPSLTSQTLYTAINDFVEPKLKQVGADVAALRNKGSARTRDDEKQFEALQAFELELIELRDTLLQLAPTYKPHHDDGVQISAAPLWPLFRHKPWQKVLKDTWAKLEKGDYDWAHLAMNYWPERVREKCKSDKSLAIAHGLEDLYIEPEAAPKKTRGRKKAGVGE